MKINICPLLKEEAMEDRIHIWYMSLYDRSLKTDPVYRMTSLELIGQVGNAVRPAVFVPQQIDYLLHGHSLTDDVRLDFVSQIGFHQLFTSIFS